MLRIEVEREDDGRWLAVAPALPGVLVYGDTEAEARAHAASLALRVISIPLRFGRKSSRPRSAADNPVCLLAGSFFHRGRRADPGRPAISKRCWRYNPPIAGSSVRGTGNLTGLEQAINRRLSGRNRQRTGERNEGAKLARLGCIARPGFPFPVGGKTCPQAKTRGRPPVSGRTSGAARFVQIILL